MGKIYLEIKNIKRTAKALFTMLAVAFLAANAFAGVGDGDLNDLKNYKYEIVYHDATGNYDKLLAAGSLSGTFPDSLGYGENTVTLNATNSPITGERKFMGWYTSRDFSTIATLNNTSFDNALYVDNKGSLGRTITVYAGWDNGEGVAVDGGLHPSEAVKISYYDESDKLIYISYYDQRYRYHLPKYPERAKLFNEWAKMTDSGVVTLASDANGQYLEGGSSDGAEIKLKGSWTNLTDATSGTTPCTFYSIMYIDANGEKVLFQDDSAVPYFYQLGSQVTLPAPLSGTTWTDVKTSATLSGITKTTSGDLILKTAGTNN